MLLASPDGREAVSRQAGREAILARKSSEYGAAHGLLDRDMSFVGDSSGKWSALCARWAALC